MTIRTTDNPADLGLSPDGISAVYDGIASWIVSDRAAGAAIGIARDGVHLTPRSFGRVAPEPDAPVMPPDAVFLTASVSKPVTCAAVGLLLERELVTLDTPVTEIVPEFGSHGKHRVTVRHLLTHTSGLPDMIPENLEYRQQHRPLDDFIKRICELELRFEPGTDISYQSMGIAMLGEIVKRTTGAPLPEFLRKEICMPLGMNDTSLGSRYIDVERVPVIRLDDDLAGQDWNWNHAYWRAFAAPWGGMFSTVRDINVFLQTFLHDGSYGGVRVFDAATVAAMTRNHTGDMPRIPHDVKQKQAWGLGWRLNQPQTTFGLGARPSPSAFGHYGATGTVVWADPETGLSCAIFTTQPDLCESEEFRRCTDSVAGTVST